MVATDILMIVVAFTLSSRKSFVGTLYMDFLIGGGFMIQCCLSLDSEQIGVLHEDGNQSVSLGTCFWSPFGNLLAFVGLVLVGIHTFVAPFVLLPGVIVVLTRASTAELLPYLGLGIILWTISMQFEYATAYLFRQLQAELACNQRLLDGATDGFGVVDSEHGVVVSASPKMLSTFGCSEMQGQHLDAFVDSGDVGNLAGFLGAAVHDSVPQVPVPVLVTCSSQKMQFDVRMVPYKMDGFKIGFIVQMVGERRSISERRSNNAGPRHDVHSVFEEDMSQADTEHPFADPSSWPTAAQQLNSSDDGETPQDAAAEMCVCCVR
eukprot:4763657-Amphidinium_carterae.1